MPKNTMMIGLALSTALVGAAPLSAAEPRSSGWSFEIGPAHRGGMDVEATGSSHTQQSGLQAARAMRSRTGLATGMAPAAAANPDDITLYADRDFDNGFVHTDALTDDDGFTVNFGYESAAAQFDSEANTLTFQRTSLAAGGVRAGQGVERSRTISTDLDARFEEDGSMNGCGARLGAVYGLGPHHGLEVGLVLGLRGYWGLERTLRASTFRQTVTERQTSYMDAYAYGDRLIDTYVFDSSQWTGPPNNGIPPEVYSNPDGAPLADPAIANLPLGTDRQSVRDGAVTRTYTNSRTSTWQAANQIYLDVEADLYQIVLGGSLSAAFTPRLSLSLRPLLLLNILDVEVQRHEEFTATYADGRQSRLASWHDHRSSTEYLFGAGVEAALTLMFGESWFGSVGGGYEWIDKASVNVGPNRVKLDLGGYTAAIAVGKIF